jgi:hypothetical protein
VRREIFGDICEPSKTDPTTAPRTNPVLTSQIVELAGGLEPPTTCLQGPGTTSRDVHRRLRSGVTEFRKRLKSGYVAVTVAVNQAMIINGRFAASLPTSWISTAKRVTRIELSTSSRPAAHSFPLAALAALG